MSKEENKYAKNIVKGKTYWAKFKETNNTKFKNKSSFYYARADYMLAQAQKPDFSTKNVNTNISMHKNVNNSKSILSNNKTRFSLKTKSTKK